MKRKKIIELFTLYDGTVATTSLSGPPEYLHSTAEKNNLRGIRDELSADLVIAGGGLGDCYKEFFNIK